MFNNRIEMKKGESGKLCAHFSLIFGVDIFLKNKKNENFSLIKTSKRFQQSPLAYRMLFDNPLINICFYPNQILMKIYIA